MKAVIMASGMGTRMRPLTDDTPKPLISVCGTPMIQTVMDGLLSAGIDEISVVTGYLGYQFDSFISHYLENHEGVRISTITNPYYETVNNISSVYVARDTLRTDDCFVCEADLYVTDDRIFMMHPDKSCYYGTYRAGYVDDWGFETDTSNVDKARIIRVKKGVTDCYNMVGVSFLKRNEAAQVADAVEQIWGTPGYEDLYWDDVVDRNLDKIRLSVWPVKSDSIAELDTVEELRAFERSRQKICE